MFVAMVAGMAGLGVLLGASRGLDQAYTAAPVELQALIMAVSMIVPMVAWMRFRHHSLQTSAEMAASMLVPSAVLFPLLWSGVASADTVLVLEHVAMPLAMIGAMLLRRGEYGL
jgi:Ca2+/H+ antiporter